MSIERMNEFVARAEPLIQDARLRLQEAAEEDNEIIARDILRGARLSLQHAAKFITKALRP